MGLIFIPNASLLIGSYIRTREERFSPHSGGKKENVYAISSWKRFLVKISQSLPSPFWHSTQPRPHTGTNALFGLGLRKYYVLAFSVSNFIPLSAFLLSILLIFPVRLILSRHKICPLAWNMSSQGRDLRSLGWNLPSQAWNLSSQSLKPKSGLSGFKSALSGFKSSFSGFKFGFLTINKALKPQLCSQASNLPSQTSNPMDRWTNESSVVLTSLNNHDPPKKMAHLFNASRFVHKKWN